MLILDCGRRPRPGWDSTKKTPEDKEPGRSGERERHKGLKTPSKTKGGQLLKRKRRKPHGPGKMEAKRGCPGKKGQGSTVTMDQEGG